MSPGDGARSYPDRVRTLLPATATCLVSALGALALVAGPALAANDQDPRPIERTIGYTCDSSFGGGDVPVTVSLRLPKTAVVDTKLAKRTIDVSITVPDELTQAMRDYGIDEVSGESTDATYSVGTKVRDIRNLVLPPTAVPAEGPLVLTGQGTMQAVRLTETKSYPVRMPGAFSAVVAVSGDVETETTLSCVLAPDAVAKIAILKVVAAED